MNERGCGEDRFLLLDKVVHFLIDLCLLPFLMATIQWAKKSKNSAINNVCYKSGYTITSSAKIKVL